MSGARELPNPTLGPGRRADVALLLEGTYPYVRGGVSAWVHQLIRGLPELTFSLVFIGGSRERRGARAYELPPNVIHLEEHFLEAPRPTEPPGDLPGDSAFFTASAALHDGFRSGAGTLPAALDAVVEHLVGNPERCRRDFLYSRRAWQEITERYAAGAPTRSFLEYFWTVRSMHAPLFVLAAAAARVPPARVLHVVSTGFAGFLATLLRRRGSPLIVTEHGIYTKERRIELLQAEWIFDDERLAPDTSDVSVGYFRQLWIGMFERIGRMTYEAADSIITLYEGNRRRQIADGAPAARTAVLPNGIALDRFRALRARRPAEIPPVIALIGRVVPIKDIRTFIRAARLVIARRPEVAAWIVGPEEEDPDYAAECRELAAAAGGAAERIKLLGFRRMDEILPRIGLNVLTSISEAQPLVVLEGFAAGVPCVATDVGCCRELIEGTDAADRALGTAGAIVQIADPEATAARIVELLADPARWRAAQQAGIARVERSYTEELMLQRYRDLYRTSFGKVP